MEKFVIQGGNMLKGAVKVSGAKNVALKVLVAACLTDEEVVIENMPLISDVYGMIDIMKELGAEISLEDHTATIQLKEFATHELSLDKAAKIRASVMLISPLLARVGEAIIPNPGGCRLGARPVDRIIEGLKSMHADIVYNSEDGYFHGKTQGLQATEYTFPKNTHTGTETLILAAVLALGTTILHNAAQEPEIDDLITLLNAMGSNIKRTAKREITIKGVKKLQGAHFTISPDRNEIVTFAIAAVLSRGDIFIESAKQEGLEEFLEKLEETGGGYEIKDTGVRFYYKGELKATDIVTSIYPGFMTDWQAPWAVLMTQAKGISTIHETVFENKLGYVHELRKMGANIKFFNPKVDNPESFYNFNLEDDNPEYFHAISITGPSKLHNAVVNMLDLRAGATVVLAALAATGKTTIFGIDKIDRGYEKFEKRLYNLGADIKRIEEK